MNSYPLTIFWLKIFALLAVEVGSVELLFAFLQRTCRTAVWRRTFCQAALIAALVIAFSELSGVGRSVVAHAFVRKTEHRSGGTAKSDPSNRSDQSDKSDKSLAASDSDERLTPDTRGPITLSSKGPQSVEHPNPVGTRSVSQIAVKKSSSVERVPTAFRELAERIPTHTSKLSDPKDGLAVTDSTVISCLGALLALGAALVSGRAFLGRFILIFLGSRRKVATDATLSQRIATIARNLKISRRIRIIESHRLVSPIAFGLLRPTVGLPLNFCERFSALKQEAMLTHELAHLAAHDPFWYLLADLIAAAFWWHPVVWWLRRQLQLSSELAADAASLMSPDGPSILAECLVEIGAQFAKPALGQLRVAGFRSDLGCRVQRLMGLEGAKWSPISRTRAILVRSITPLVLTGAVILCTARAVPRQLTQGESMNTMKKNWQRTLATFATVAAMQAPNVIVGQQNPP